ncbi:MAG: pentapeptide repeat-containing protein, partial [Rhizobiales bacterium]|nr:pentapeptide repeat-containing protein [Hyphomicrobiales bacterium]
MKLVIVATIGALALSASPASAGCKTPPKPGVDWSGCSKKLIMLPGAKLKQANLSETDLTSTDLGNAMLDRAILDEANLTRASLKDASLAGASMRKTYG